MIAADFEIVRQFYPSSKWVNPNSQKHKEALLRLAEFDKIVAMDALIAMKHSFARTFITSEELATEIKRILKRSRTVEKQKVQHFCSEEIKQDYKKALEQLLGTSRVDIEEAISYGRSAGLVKRDAIDPDVNAWSLWTVGIVAAIVQKLNS